MKVECIYCRKIITNPFVDTNTKGGIYFFCNREHRDEYEKFLVRRAIMCNPIGAMIFVWGVIWGFIKCFFKRKIKSLGG